MNRIEALRILGLDEDATDEDIKTAYRESAQILHPDRFEGNKKLQERATEQFKNLQEAYNYLTKGPGSREKSSRSTSTSAGTASRSASGQGSSAGRSSTSRASSAKSRTAARMAGIEAARTQLVAQRDAATDERRNSVIMAVIGIAVAAITSRRTVGIGAAIFAIACAAGAWGIVQAISAHRTVNMLDEHIDALNEEEKQLAAEMGRES